jgi:hypothetical protein
MPYLRFNQVFFGLMALSFLSAFVITRTISERAQGHIQVLFEPVARPASALAGWALDRFHHTPIRDDGSPDHPRSSAEIYAENDRLRVEVANLVGLVQRLQEREAERATLGDVSALCTRFNVMGADPSNRQVLLLSGSGAGGLREGMAVLNSNGIVGRISRVTVKAAQVTVLSDRLSKRLTAVFARFGDPSFKSGEPFLVTGAGDGTMASEIRESDVKGIGVRLNDWVVLNDRDWPLALNNYRIGYVLSITPSRHPGFVDVRIAPAQDLMRLRDVMVMNKEEG